MKYTGARGNADRAHPPARGLELLRGRLCLGLLLPLQLLRRDLRGLLVRARRAPRGEDAEAELPLRLVVRRPPVCANGVGESRAPGRVRTFFVVAAGGGEARRWRWRCASSASDARPPEEGATPAAGLCDAARHHY